MLFSESIHLNADSEADKEEFVFLLEKLIPRSKYDQSNPLQMASLENDVDVLDAVFHSESSPGILLERRGNWAIATLVSESLSAKISQGSVLFSIGDLQTLMMGFDEIVKALALWKPPLRLRFLLSPSKMGWLMLMTNQKGRRFVRRNNSSKAWGEFHLLRGFYRAVPFAHSLATHVHTSLLNRRESLRHIIFWYSDSFHGQE